LSQPILAISYFFHLVATVVWLGGLLVLSVWVFPEAQKQLRAHPARYQLMNRLRKRFTPWANFSLVILIASGMFQMSADQQYLGMLNFSNSWSRALLWKHIAMLGMLVCKLNPAIWLGTPFRACQLAHSASTGERRSMGTFTRSKK
jgi:uncharacterized membrane protein